MAVRNQLDRWTRSLKTKSTLAIIITAAVLLEVTSAVQYWFARKGIREEIERRAQTELQVKNLEIQKVMASVESAASNTVWSVEDRLRQPDSIASVADRLVRQNPYVVGCGVAFVPDYYKGKGRWFEPYALQLDSARTEISQIGGENHDYLQAQWFQEGLSAGRGHWSDPYFDDAGAKMMLCTYTVPVHDEKGQAVAVLGADVSLDWLGSLINAHPLYPSAANLMVSREGQIMACPVETLVLNKTIQELASARGDTTAERVNREMMEGLSGQAVVTDDKGKKNYVFYAPVEGDTGWSMAIICSDREIYQNLRRIGLILLILMLLGMALLAYILYRTARGFNRLQVVNAQKASMERELNVASGIQRAMLPKIFPPYPDREDVDIYGSLAAARGAGGDLFDFYIRDEKLFFCIGDVSGKGIPASLVMAVTRAQFRTISAHESFPDRIVGTMNDLMAGAENDSNMFVTMLVGVLDLKSGQLLYCNAGHEPPLLVGRGVGVLRCDPNIPVGIMPGWNYSLQVVRVERNSTIFLYTDGLDEAEDVQHRQFGKPRVLETARTVLASGRNTPRQLVGDMQDAVHAFVGDAEQSDDLTLLAVQYFGK